MTSGWNYLLLANVYVSLFFGFYWIALRKETFFVLNRVYLLAGLLVALLLPFIQNEWLQQLPVTQKVQYAIQLGEVTISTKAKAPDVPFDYVALLCRIYLAGMFLFALRLIVRIYKVRFMLMRGVPVSCSFFNKISLGDNITADSPIFEHEMVHVRQWHSADVLLAEVFAIINWFNPLAYLYKKTIKEVHEFIADREALHGTSKHTYASLLLSQTFEIPNTLVNTFFNHTLLKQRIMMIDKKRSRKMALLKYSLCVPMFVLMLGLSTAMAQKTDKPQKVTEIIVAPPSGSNKPDYNAQQHDEVFTAVEHEPGFPGGMDKFYEFLGKNIKYPADMREHKIEGKVIVTFVVEKDGSLSNIKVLKQPAPTAGKEIERVMTISPKWIPGKQNGHVVRVQYTVPVNFTMVGDKKG